MTTNQQLRQLMDELSLSRQDVADILHYSIHAVNAWLRPADNKAYRRCPYIVIQLLKSVKSA